MRHNTGSVEECGFDLIDSEVLLESSFLEMPIDNFYNLVGFVFDLDLMDSKISPIVAL
jgi:hypothetical protein